MKLTDEQRKRMNLEPTSQKFNRGWSRDKIKNEIKKKGFTLSEFERECGFRHNSISQALMKRYPKIDKAIAAFLEVHESIIWPNRYFVNGVAIHKMYNIETRSDEELNKLNAEVSKPAVIITVRNWVGDDGQPEIITHESRPPVLGVDDGTIVNDPFYDEPIYEDVSPMADGRPVSLPPGMKTL